MTKRGHSHENAYTALQVQHPTEIHGLQDKIQALEGEQVSISAAQSSSLVHLKSDLATRDEPVQTLKIEVVEKAAALASHETKHVELRSLNSDTGEQLSNLQREHRLPGQTNDKMARDRQQLGEAIQKSSTQAQQDRERISSLESQFGEAENKITQLRSQASTSLDKVSGLEQKLTEARECIERQADTLDQEQDSRYDTEVAVMNQKVESAIARVASKILSEELDQANNRGKEIEDKMRALEGRLQSRTSAPAGLTLVTWERVGNVFFTKLCFTCREEEVLQCVRSLELCSQENSDKWDYIGFRPAEDPRKHEAGRETLGGRLETGGHHGEMAGRRQVILRGSSRARTGYAHTR